LVEIGSQEQAIEAGRLPIALVRRVI